MTPATVLNVVRLLSEPEMRRAARYVSVCFGTMAALAFYFATKSVSFSALAGVSVAVDFLALTRVCSRISPRTDLSSLGVACGISFCNAWQHATTRSLAVGLLIPWLALPVFYLIDRYMRGRRAKTSKPADPSFDDGVR